MTLTVSPYLIAPHSGRSPQPAANGAAEGTSTPQKSGDAVPDSVTLSPTAQQAMAQKTPLQSTLETILASVQTSTGPTLRFGSATNGSTGKTLDRSC